MNKEAKIKLFLERQAAELEKYKFKLDIEEVFEEYQQYDMRAYSSDLYGTVGSVSFKGNIQLITKIINDFVVVDRVMNRTSTVGFPPASFDTDGEKTKIDPIMFYVEKSAKYNNDSIKANFYIQTNIGLISVSVELENPSSFAYITGEYKSSHGCSCIIDNIQLHKQKPLSWMKDMKMGRGGEEYFNSFYIYSDEALSAYDQIVNILAKGE